MENPNQNSRCDPMKNKDMFNNQKNKIRIKRMT